MLTSQEIFDRVAVHLLTQKKKAKEYGGICMYRTSDGLSCAVGCLIPDHLYSEELEGLVPYELQQNGLLSQIGIAEEQVGLLASLQVLHDAILVEEWARELGKVATDRGLDAKVLERFS